MESSERTPVVTPDPDFPLHVQLEQDNFVTNRFVEITFPYQIIINGLKIGTTKVHNMFAEAGYFRYHFELDFFSRPKHSRHGDFNMLRRIYSTQVYFLTCHWKKA